MKKKCMFLSVLFYMFTIGISYFTFALSSEDKTELNPSIFVDHSVNDFHFSEKDYTGEKNNFHLFSHGRPGQLLLENKWMNEVQIVDWLESKNLLKYKTQLNVYGCEFARGEEGESACKYLQKMLGISVAASEDITGAGGNWKLEWGHPETALSFPEYPHNLQCATTAAGNKMASGGYSVVLRTANGFVVWGEVSTSSGRHSASPIAVTPANGFNYSGTPLLATAAGHNSYQLCSEVPPKSSNCWDDFSQKALLTTTGIYVWGSEGALVSELLTTGKHFQLIGKGQHLPPGVLATDIVDMVANTHALMVLTRSGEVWVLSLVCGYYGDGTKAPVPSTCPNCSSLAFGLHFSSGYIRDFQERNAVFWHQVKKSNGVPLRGVTQLSVNGIGGFAYAPGDGFYTWGLYPSLGNGLTPKRYSCSTACWNGIFYATKMVSPPLTGEPVQVLSTGLYTSYLVLDPSGFIHFLGSPRVAGRGDNQFYPTWTTVKGPNGEERLEDVKAIFTLNSVWDLGAAAAITCDGTPYFWGANILGASGYPYKFMHYPTVPTGFVPGVDRASYILLNGNYSLMVKEDGTICFAGGDLWGASGNGVFRRTRNLPSRSPHSSDIFPFDCNRTPQYANLCIPEISTSSCEEDLPRYSISKSVTDTTPREGEIITYIITVNNVGSSTANNIDVSDMLPSGLTYVNNSISGGNVNNVNGNFLTWRINTMVPGTTYNLSFNARVNSGTAGTIITNIASVTCTECTAPTNSQPRLIVPEASFGLSATKTVNNASPAVNQTINYTITVMNPGPNQASNVTISDTVPSGLTYVNNSISGGDNNNVNGTLLTWTINNLAAGTSTSVTFSALVNEGSLGQSIVNIANINCNECTTSTNTPPITIIPKIVPVINGVKTVDNVNPAVGDLITYTIAVSNAGPGTASNVDIYDTVPSGLTYQNGSISGGDLRAGESNPLIWRINTLTVGATTSVSFRAIVSQGAFGNSITNFATIYCAECPTSTNTPPQVITPANLPRIIANKAVSDSTPEENDIITFTITVSNTGSRVATSVDISDRIPSGLTYIDNSIFGGDSNNGVISPKNWRINNLPAGSSAQVGFQARVNTGTAGSTITNNASVNCTECASAINISRTVSPEALSRLIAIKTISDTTPSENDIVTYTITVSNTGPVAATLVDISDAIPTGLTYVNNSIFGGNTRSDVLSTLTWRINSLSVGSTAQVGFRARINAGTADSDITNIAVVDCTECPTATNTPPSTITPSALSSLSVIKTVSDTTPNENDEITYTITVSNAGPSAATLVNISDRFPSGVTYIAGSIFGGNTRNGDVYPLTWRVNNMPVGSTAQVGFRARVNAGTAGSIITNIAVANCTECPADVNSPPRTIAPEAQSSLSAIKTVSDTTPNENDEITYTITVSNAGPSAATSVDINDSFPSGVTYIAGSIFGGNTRNGDVYPLTWRINSLPAGSTSQVGFRARVNVGTAGSIITNIAVANCTECPTAISTPPRTIAPEAQSALNAIKTVSDTTPNENDEITYTITVSNAGPSAATLVNISDRFPSGVTYIAGSIFGGNTRNGDVYPLTWRVDNMPVGSTAQVGFRARVNAGTAGSIITNIAVANCTECPTATNTPPRTITPEARSALSAIKTVSDTTPNENEEIMYTITVSNAGPSTATSVDISDSFPSGVTYIAGSIFGGNTRNGDVYPLTWRINSLPAGSTSQVGFRVRVNVGTAGSIITNIAVANCTECPTATNTPPRTIAPEARSALNAIKTVSDTTPNENDEITYTITVSNAGPSAATSVDISDSFPAGVTYIENSIFGGDARNDGVYPIIWRVNNLSVGSTAQVGFRVRVNVGTAGSIITNIAVANCTECPTATNTPPRTITPEARSALSAIKTVSDTTPTENEEITYTITVSNAGPSTATSVDISDSFPSGVTYIAGSIFGGNTRNDGVYPLTWRVNSLPVGSTAQVGFRVRVNAGTAGSIITNIAVANCAECPTATNTPPRTIAPEARSALNAIKTVSDTTPNENEEITYTITVSNAGPSAATSIDISDSFPAGVTYVEDSIFGGDARNDDVYPIIWRVNNLSVGSTAQVGFRVRVNAGTAGSIITNIAVVNCTECPTPTNTPPRTITPESRSVLSAIKTVSDTTPTENDEITYTITVSNAGPSTATLVDISDRFPSGVTYIEDSIFGGDTRNDDVYPLTWRVNNLPVGSTSQVGFRARVNRGAAGGNITNIAVVNCTECPTATNTPPQTITPNALSRINLVKTVSDPTPDENDEITYTITVSNAGPSTATLVDIIDGFPSGLTYIDNSITGGNTRNDDTYPLTWRINSLAVGATEQVGFRVRVNTGTRGTSITNSASSICTECMGTTNSPPVVIIVENQVLLSAKLMLQGALWNVSPNEPILMRDDLRSKGLLPSSEPYTAMNNFTHVGGGGGETVDNTNVVYANRGSDSIVDWVFVELRDPNNNMNVLHTRSALVQRDGDVVEVDGVTPLTFSNVGAASYYVVVKHRNHLGMMTSNAVPLSAATTEVDFTDPNGSYWDDGSLIYAGSSGVLFPLGANLWTLWGGNANVDNDIIYTGPDTDPNAIFSRVINDPGNPNEDPEHILNNYYAPEDTTMDGRIIYTSVDNDTIIIFDNIFNHHKGNLENPVVDFIIRQQVP